MRPYFATFFILALTVAGCAVKPQTVVIDPNPEMMAWGGGNRQSLMVSAADLRGTTRLGYLKNETKDRAPVTTGNDVAAAIAAKVREAAVDNGFALAQGGAYTDASLKVDVLKISYTSAGKYVAPKVTVAVELKAVAQRGGATYAPTYTIENEVVEALPLNNARNERIVNEAVSKTLQMIIADEGLWRFLTTGVPPQGK